MKHVGDITKLNGAELAPVWVVTGGSPCQDLSVAGARAGLAGARSGLFMEQIRIIREMRENDRKLGRADELIRPRYSIWENVTGAYSSNQGRDFQTVLTEFVRIAEPESPDVPLPDGGWPHAGALVAEDGRWSIAWRTHDLQFWGRPQRRRRISVVADYGGATAAEVVFKRDTGTVRRPEISSVAYGVPRDTEPCGAARERAAGSAENRAGESSGDGGEDLGDVPLCSL